MKHTLKNNFYFLLLISLTWVGEAFGQTAKIEPPQPKWGSTLTVTYNPKAFGAKFYSSHDVYIQARLAFADHDQTSITKMSKEREMFTAEFGIHQPLSHATFYFITLDDWDKQATVSTMIFRPDGIPVKGAYQKILSPF